MSKQEAERLAGALERCAPVDFDGDFAAAAALLRQWPDGEPVPVAQRVPNRRGRHDYWDYGETYSADLTPENLYTAPPDQSARIAELEKENANLVRGLREATESPTFMGEPVPDARIAKLAELAEQSTRIVALESALRFYAAGDHFNRSDDAWDTVSGEPRNFWCDEAGTATVEDGTVAREALVGVPLEDEQDERIAELERQRDALLEACNGIVDFCYGPEEGKRPDVFARLLEKARVATNAIKAAGGGK